MEVNEFASDTHRRVVAQFTRPMTAREAADALKKHDPYVEDDAYGAQGVSEYISDLEADGLLTNLGTFDDAKAALDAQDKNKDTINFQGSRESFSKLAENPLKHPYLDEDDHFVQTKLAHEKLAGEAPEDA